MVTETFRTLDEHLSRSECDSSDWADGLGSTVARELLEKFEDEEWRRLADEWRNREVQWRACLVGSLHPHYGETAQEMLISALEDSDPEVAFLALSGVAFHCGVSDCADGVFEDGDILHARFRRRVSCTDGIREKIRFASEGCAPFLQPRFDLLLKLVS